MVTTMIIIEAGNGSEGNTTTGRITQPRGNWQPSQLRNPGLNFELVKQLRLTLSKQRNSSGGATSRSTLLNTVLFAGFHIGLWIGEMDSDDYTKIMEGFYLHLYPESLIQ